MLHDQIKSFFKARADVWAVYVFGSQAKNKTSRHSDVDLAILFNPTNIPDFATKIELKESLSSLLKTDVDLVVMNTANPVLKHQIYKHGQIVLNKNARYTTGFWVKSLVEYCDLKISRSLIEKNILNRKVYG